MLLIFGIQMRNMKVVHWRKFQWVWYMQMIMLVAVSLGLNRLQKPSSESSLVSVYAYSCVLTTSRPCPDSFFYCHAISIFFFIGFDPLQNKSQSLISHQSLCPSVQFFYLVYCSQVLLSCIGHCLSLQQMSELLLVG